MVRGNRELELATRASVEEALNPFENLGFTTLKPNSDVRASFSGDKEEPTVEVGDKEYVVDPPALEAMARAVKIPAGYLRRCPFDLLLPHLNHWFGPALPQEVRLVSRDNHILSASTDRVKSNPVSTMRLLSLAEQAIGSGHILGYHQVSSGLDYSSVAVVTDKSFTVNPGDSAEDADGGEDVLYGGVAIKNSALGKETIEVSPYIFRQWCSNGAISSESLGRYTRKRRGNDSLEPWMAEIIGNACTSLDQEFDRIQQLVNCNIAGHIPDVLASLAKKYHIPVKLRKDIEDRAFSEKARSMYDIYNAVTYVASHSEGLDPRIASRLQKVGGCVTVDHELCPSCHRVL